MWAALRHADVVTLDVNLCEEDGLDIVRQLRRDGYSTPVIVISGEERDGLEAEAFAAGATLFVVKPFDIMQLLDMLRDEHTAHADRADDVVVDLVGAAAGTREKAWFMS